MTDYVTDFVQENEERITELNNALLTLERDPADNEAMESIFRVAHTLKSNCGAMGFESASDLAHAIEDVLDGVRTDTLDVTPELMDVIFDAVDELEVMFDEVAATGEIETDPSAKIDALRAQLESEVWALPLETPSTDEIDDVIRRFDPPDDNHEAYFARIAIAEPEDDGVTNGALVVNALVDAFDLIGTEPPRSDIEAGEYGGRIDAVFGTAVGKAAITSGLEPVEEVTDFELLNVSERFEAVAAETDTTGTDAVDELLADAGDDLSPDEASDLEVDELLDEFDEFDNLDEMVEEVDDDDLDAFDEMGDAGSFDDLFEDEELDPDAVTAEPAAADGETGETPTDADTGSATTGSEHETETGTGTETEAGASADDNVDVDDADAVFNELKNEVEMVGFDELQDELEDLEFDEFDSDDEVDMDELIGDDVDVDDDSFLEDPEPSDADVDDILVDSDESLFDGAEPSDEDVDDILVTADDVDEPTADTSATASDASNGTEPEPAAVSDSETDATAEVDTDATGEQSTGEYDSTAETQSATDDGSFVDELSAAAADVDALADKVEDEVRADDTLETADPTDATGVESGESDGSPSPADDSDPVAVDASGDAAGADGVEDDDPVAEVEGGEDDAIGVKDEPLESGDEVEDGTIEKEGSDDGLEADDTAAETDSDDQPESIDDPVTADADDADDSTGSVDSSESSDERAFDDGFETAFEEPDDTADEGAPASVDGDGVAFDDADNSSFGEPDDSVFDNSDDTMFEEPDDAFADSADGSDGSGTFGDDEFDEVFGGDFDDSFADDFGDDFGSDDFGSDGSFDASSSSSSSADTTTESFGDEPSDTDGDTDSAEDVIRRIDEPTFEIPDITVPETTEQPDTDQQTGEIQSVRVDVDQIDSLLTLVEGLVTSRVRLRHAVTEGEEPTALENEIDDLEDLTTELQETVMDVRLVPLQTVTNRLPRVVRDIAREQEKTVSFEMTGEDVELDRSILDRIGDPLIHLVRNAVDHGIEPPEERERAEKPPEGTVEVHATRSRDRVTITVEDDGAGLDPDRLRDEAVEADILVESEAAELSDDEVYDLIFHSGLSTADEVTDVSGRGVGMDVVKRTIEDLEGTVSIDSEVGEGTSVTMTLPVSVAIDDILFVESGGEEFGIPTKAVEDIGPADRVTTTDGRPVLPGSDGDYSVIPLDDALETPRAGENGNGMVVRIRNEVRPIALRCDYVHGQQEVVVKPFEGFMSDIPGLSGATVRGRGEVVNILDVTTL
ncbi:chemotaxis protein CheA [Natronorubrum sp. JWXQ-INN-674]|uniref:Chemotaxis protein CheA n=1 Tax=Natronorubrum halalkaliphilum TaxID=2691917 RepID=A0A6B0VRE2_9EURY|nr:chemotaxis protein CheA [Natronorubrum halalkaliphilum]MXV64004.1 chemotaxis protein CheA [Natronorubrum halalkaliphilum]